MIRDRLQQVLLEAKQSRLDSEQLRAIVQAELAAIAKGDWDDLPERPVGASPNRACPFPQET